MVNNNSATKSNEALFLLAKAFLLAIDDEKEIDIDLLQDICEGIIEREEFETVDLLKEAIGEMGI